MIKLMKKGLAAAITILSYLATASRVFAQVDIGITPPKQGIAPTATVGTVLSNALTIIFVFAAIAVLFMLIWGAFQWVTSGGDKEAVGKARGRIIHALIGLAILALAFLITNVVGQIVGINILDLQKLPTLGQQCPANQTFDTKLGRCV